MMKVPSRYAELSPEELKQSMTSQLEGNTNVMEADTVELSGFNAVRIVTSRQKSRGIFGVTIGTRSYREDGEAPVEKSLTYIFTHAGKFVSIIFSTEPEFFADLLPIFEKSALTLEIH